MMVRLPLLAVLLAALSHGTASWLPWSDLRLQNPAPLQEAPVIEVSILPVNGNNTCLRLSTSISVLVQYKTDGVQDGIIQVVVPQLNNVNVVGSCGPEAFVQLSWTPDVVTTEPSAALVVEEELLPQFVVAGDGGNILRINFVQLNETYAISNITGIINIQDVPEDYTANTTIEVSLSDQLLFETPLGVVYMCYGPTIVVGEGADNITSVGVLFTDIQLLAYYEGYVWPAQAKYCQSSDAASDHDSSIAIVVSTSAAVMGVGLLGAFI